MKKKLPLIIFCLLLFLISFVLRIYHLDQNSPAIYADEAGHYWHFLNITEGHPDIINRIYLSTFSFTWIFGVNPLGVRFGSALFGSLISVVMFYFGYIISKQKISIAIICGILGSILPWSFMISRIGYTHVPIIVLLGVIHLILLIKAKKFSDFIISLIPVALSVFYYPTILIVSPISIIIIFFNYIFPKFSLQQKQFVLIGGTFFALLIGYIFVTRYNIFSSQGRGGDLAIWRDVNVSADFNQYRGLARLADPNTEKIANKIFFNYPLSIVHVFVKNYLSFFSFDFLFLKGDNVLRHSTGMVGEFFPFLLPLMIYGSYIFFKQSSYKHKLVFLVWILMSPIPAAITKDGATYLLRVITLMPILTYFCAQGTISFFELLKNKWQKTIYIFVIIGIGLFSTLYFFYGYFYVYPAISASSWEYGFKELSDFQTSNPGKMLIIWDDKYPVGYFCFWQKLSTGVCDQTKMNASEMVNGSRVDQPLDNLLFSLPQNESDLTSITLKYKPTYIVIPVKYSTFFSKFETKATLTNIVKYPDQTTAFSIFKSEY